MSKHRARSNDRGSGECLADRGLAGGLGTIESGRRGWRSVEVRYVDQPGNADARGDLGDAPGTFGVYVVKSEISSSCARTRARERERYGRPLRWLEEKRGKKNGRTYFVS